MKRIFQILTQFRGGNLPMVIGKHCNFCNAKKLIYFGSAIVYIWMVFASCANWVGSGAGQINERNESVSQALISENHYRPNIFENQDQTFKENIKTVLLYPQGNPLSYPILQKNKEFRLELTFDDLDADIKNYSYTIVHYNADWSAPSDLSPFDYIEGFTEDSIDDYRFAFNTLQEYTQYRLFLPNNRMRMTKTGNYLLTVFEENDPENIVLTKRFMYFDDKMPIQSSTVLRPNITRYLPTHQRLRFSINHTQFPRLSPMSDIKLMILQNGRWDNAVMNLPPQFIRNNELVYDYSDQSLFKAGKEFRFFGFRDLQFSTERIKNVWQEQGYNIVDVLPDQKRHTGKYSFWKDMNGRYLIGRFGGYTRVDADYAWVQLTLNEAKIDSGDVYVLGEMCNWLPQEEFKMKFDEDINAYTADIYLKQGIYNYQYVIYDDKTGQIDDTTLEGNYWETENDYIILVYYRPFNDRYDQLVGLRVISSKL